MARSRSTASRVAPRPRGKRSARARASQVEAPGGRRSSAGSGTSTESSSLFRSPAPETVTGFFPTTVSTGRGEPPAKRTIPRTRSGTRATTWTRRTGPTAFRTVGAEGAPVWRLALVPSSAFAISPAGIAASVAAAEAEVVLTKRTLDPEISTRSGSPATAAAGRSVISAASTRRPGEKPCQRTAPVRKPGSDALLGSTRTSSAGAAIPNE